MAENSTERILAKLDELPRRKEFESLRDELRDELKREHVKHMSEVASIMETAGKKLLTRVEELVEPLAKDLKKATAALEEFEETGGGGAEETADVVEKTIEKYLDKGKGLFEFFIGSDKASMEALRSRFRNWVVGEGGKGGKKAIAVTGEVD